MKKFKLNPYLKPIIGLLIFIVVLLFIIICLIQLAKKTDFFRVKEVLIRENNAGPLYSRIDLSYLIGRSIITIDLAAEEQRILKSHPVYREINLIRIMPDKICAIFTERKPVAYLKLRRYFYIDEDAVLFDISGSGLIADLPLISGLETKKFALYAGKRYNYKEILSALVIIKAIKNNKALKGFSLKKIDIFDPDNTSFFIASYSQQNPLCNTKEDIPDNVLQVKVGQDYINDKINILGSVLIQAKNDLNNINYIDLRFKDPVIKLKEKG